jgi:5-methylcytosine-specific restriction protein A
MEFAYGILGKGAIRIHHLKGLKMLDSTYSLDATKDLVPVCPNCHLIIHRGRDEPIGVLDLRRIMERVRQQRVRLNMENGGY